MASHQPDLQDRGFRYGDGIFRTMRIHDGRILLEQQHAQCFLHDAGALAIAVPPDWLIQVRDAAALLDSGVLRVTLTRGRSDRGYAPDPNAEPALYLETGALPPSVYRPMLRLRLCEMRLSQQPRLAGVKHLNRLEQVLARAEWAPLGDDAAEEGVMLDQSGMVISGTMSNVFAVLGDGRDPEIVTPALDQCGVAGAVRAWVLSAGAAALDVTVAVRALTPAELRNAREIFVTNAVWGVRSIQQFEGRNCVSTDFASRLRDQLGPPYAADACGINHN